MHKIAIDKNNNKKRDEQYVLIFAVDVGKRHALNLSTVEY